MSEGGKRENPAIFVVAAALSIGAAQAADHPLLLKADKVFTGDGAAHAGWAVLVSGNRIAGVGPADKIALPADAEIIALPGMTLLPGLIDLHSHVLLYPYNQTSWDDQVMRQSAEYRTILATQHAADTLRAGFTTLRDLGSEGAGYADVAIKRAIDEGKIPGPRLFVAAKAIVAAHSYGPAARNFRPDMDLPHGAQEVTGIDAGVDAVREQSSHGADWIKLYADYRTGPDGSAHATFSQEELNAMVRTAHDSGRKVAVHAATDEGMRRATLAGVDTIEHGYGGTEATFKLMAEHHVAFLPTLTAEEGDLGVFSALHGGRSAHRDHAGRRPRLPDGPQGRCRHRLRQRCRRLRPWRERARDRMDGQGRHDPGRGPARRHRCLGRDPRQGRPVRAESRKGCWPIWSR